MNACNVLSTILSLLVLLSPSRQDSPFDNFNRLFNQNTSRLMEQLYQIALSNIPQSLRNCIPYTMNPNGTFSFIAEPNSSSSSWASNCPQMMPYMMVDPTNNSTAFYTNKTPIYLISNPFGSVTNNAQAGENSLPGDGNTPGISRRSGVQDGNIVFPQSDEHLKDGCVLPEYPEGGSYELGGCAKPCNKRTGDKVPKMSLLIYSCKENHILNGSSISACIDGEWYNPPSCFKICPALRSTSVDITCKYQGEITSCTKFVLPGTRAKLSCKPSYKLPVTSDPGYKEITCLDNGSWNRHIYRCLPECGTSAGEGTAIIVEGFRAEIGIFPWHVGIYRIRDNTEYEQICAGSLINSNLVVSVAHCFYNETANELNDASNYAVAAGKHFRDWKLPERYSQKSMVESIEIGRRYSGARGNYAQDIALVKLKTSFELTELVRPVCLDWENIFELEQLQPENSGKVKICGHHIKTGSEFRVGEKVIGWGKNISGQPTNTLFEINMPYVPYHQCVSGVPQNFIRFITPDKFCAGQLNGSSLCDGDSGGGLCFKKDGIWYLRGIVSLSPVKEGVCDYNSYVAFTRVNHFTDWIRNAYVNV